MAKIPCDAATLTWGSLVAEVRNVTITSTVQQIQGQALEDPNPETFVTGVGYTISGEMYAVETTGAAIFAAGDTDTAVLTTQAGTPVTLFSGACYVTSAGDTQGQGALEMQQFTLTSNGAPVTVNI